MRVPLDGRVLVLTQIEIPAHLLVERVAQLAFGQPLPRLARLQVQDACGARGRAREREEGLLELNLAMTAHG